MNENHHQILVLPRFSLPEANGAPYILGYAVVIDGKQCGIGNLKDCNALAEELRASKRKTELIMQIYETYNNRGDIGAFITA
ncbi:MAG: hypothetical protein AB9866_21505 [Syntrophobacteraceae bacterium]